MTGLFLNTVNASICASWLILTVLLLRLLLRKSPRWVIVLLWGVVALRLLCPFSLESALSLIPSAQTIPMTLEMDATPAIDSGIQAVNSALNPILREFSAPAPGESANPLQITTAVLANVWLLGVAALLAYAAVSSFLLHRRMETAVLLRGNVFESERADSPFVFGLVRPRIYLPFGLSAQTLEHVVAHEQAHIRRKDHWIKPLGFLLLAIHWFNPLMWLAYTLLCRDIELACDEKVIGPLAAAQRADYAEALVTCSVRRHAFAACPLSFGEVGVKSRIRSVLRYQKPAFLALAAAVLACAALAVCFLTDPLPSDSLTLLKQSSLNGSNAFTYRLSLGAHVQSAQLRAEQWVNGTCVQSAPIPLTAEDSELSLLLNVRRDSATNARVGVDVQIGTNGPGGSLITYFPFPEGLSTIGWGCGGYPLDERIAVAPESESILAALIFDTGSGIRTFDMPTLQQESERLASVGCAIVIRADFSAESFQSTAVSPAHSRYLLTIGREDVAYIEMDTAHSSGGCANADGSAFKLGEQVWLEPLDGFTSLHGATLTALNHEGEVVWALSIPAADDAPYALPITHDGFTLSAAP